MARLNVTSEILNNSIQTARRMRDPNRDVTQAEVRKASVRQSINKPATPPPVQARELKIHPDTPTADTYQPAIEQSANSLAVLAALLPKELTSLVVQAHNEQKLVGGAANA